MAILPCNRVQHHRSEEHQHVSMGANETELLILYVRSVLMKSLQTEEKKLLIHKHYFYIINKHIFFIEKL